MTSRIVPQQPMMHHAQSEISLRDTTPFTVQYSQPQQREKSPNTSTSRGGKRTTTQTQSSPQTTMLPALTAKPYSPSSPQASVYDIAGDEQDISAASYLIPFPPSYAPNQQQQQQQAMYWNQQNEYQQQQQQQYDGPHQWPQHQPQPPPSQQQQQQQLQTYDTSSSVSQLPLSQTLGGPILSDHYLTQIQNRRYNLMIRAPPTTAGIGANRGEKKKKVYHTHSLDADIIAAQQIKNKFLTSDANSSAVTNRNQVRLQSMYGKQSDYARKQKKLANEKYPLPWTNSANSNGGQQQNVVGSPSAASLLKRQQKYTSEAEDDREQKEEKQIEFLPSSKQQQQQHSMIVPASRNNIGAPTLLAVDSSFSSSTYLNSTPSSPANASSSASYKTRRSIYTYLTSPTQHQFFSHLAPHARPLIQQSHIEKIYDEVGERGVQVLMELETQGRQFSSVAELVEAVVEEELVRVKEEARRKKEEQEEQEKKKQKRKGPTSNMIVQSHAAVTPPTSEPQARVEQVPQQSVVESVKTSTSAVSPSSVPSVQATPAISPVDDLSTFIAELKGETLPAKQSLNNDKEVDQVDTEEVVKQEEVPLATEVEEVKQQPIEQPISTEEVAQQPEPVAAAVEQPVEQQQQSSNPSPTAAQLPQSAAVQEDFDIWHSAPSPAKSAPIGLDGYVEEPQQQQAGVESQQQLVLHSTSFDDAQQQQQDEQDEENEDDGDVNDQQLEPYNNNTSSSIFSNTTTLIDITQHSPQDLNELLREATYEYGGGSRAEDPAAGASSTSASAQPLILSFGDTNVQFPSWRHLVLALRDAYESSEKEKARQAKEKKFYDAVMRFLCDSTQENALFNDIVYSEVKIPSQEEFHEMLSNCSDSLPLLLIHLHALNRKSQQQKFEGYTALCSELGTMTQQSNATKQTVYEWLQQDENQLIKLVPVHPEFDDSASVKVGSVLELEHTVVPASVSTSTALVAADSSTSTTSIPLPSLTPHTPPFSWSLTHITHLYEDTSAGEFLLPVLKKLLKRGKKFTTFSSLAQAVQQEAWKQVKAKMKDVVERRKKEGKLTIRSFLLQPTTHLFSSPVSISEKELNELYELGEQALTRVGVRLVGRRLLSAGETTVEGLKYLLENRSAPQDLTASSPPTIKFASYPEMYHSLSSIIIHSTMERCKAQGLEEVRYPRVDETGEEVGNEVGTSDEMADLADSTNVDFNATSTSVLINPETFQLTHADAQRLLEYLASPSCTLFSHLSSSLTRQTLAIRTSDLNDMIRATECDSAYTLSVLQKLNAAGRVFTSFEALVEAVKLDVVQNPIVRSTQQRLGATQEMLGASSSTALIEVTPPQPQISEEHYTTILSFLSSSHLLYDRMSLSSKITKDQIQKLIDLGGGGVFENLLGVNLKDLTENGPGSVSAAVAVAAAATSSSSSSTTTPQSLCCTSFFELQTKAAKNWQALVKAQEDVREYLVKVEKDLFVQQPSDGSSMSAIDLSTLSLPSFFHSCGSGRCTLSYIQSFVSAKQRFSSISELIVAVRSSHLVTQNMKEKEVVEKEKQKLGKYLVQTEEVKELFVKEEPVGIVASGKHAAQPSAPSISVTESSLREMLHYGSWSAANTIQILRTLHARGVRVRSFDELVQACKKQVVYGQI